MLVDSLLSKLTCGGRSIVFVHFSGGQRLLSGEALANFPEITQCDWGLLEINGGPRSKVPVLVFPSNSGPEIFSVIGDAEKIGGMFYIAIAGSADEFAEAAGKVLRYVAQCGMLIRKVYEVTSPEPFQCFEIRSVHVENMDYIRVAASEIVLERRERKRIKKVALERERMCRLAQRRADEYRDRLTVEREQKRALETELTDVKQELAFHRDYARQLKASFSYRFGHLFAEAGRFPAKLPFLPLALTRLVGGAVLRKLRIWLGKRSTAAKRKTAGVDPKEGGKGLWDVSRPFSLSAKSFPEPDALRFGEYLCRYSPQVAWIGFIGGSRLNNAAEGFEHVYPLHPNTWYSNFKNNPPRRVVVETSVIEEGGAWASCLEGGAYGYPGQLMDMLRFCRTGGIETALWCSSFVASTSLAPDVAAWFDHIYHPNPARTDRGENPVGQPASCPVSAGSDKEESRMAVRLFRLNEKL